MYRYLLPIAFLFLACTSEAEPGDGGPLTCEDDAGTEDGGTVCVEALQNALSADCYSTNLTDLFVEYGADMRNVTLAIYLSSSGIRWTCDFNNHTCEDSATHTTRMISRFNGLPENGRDSGVALLSFKGPRGWGSAVPTYWNSPTLDVYLNSVSGQIVYGSMPGYWNSGAGTYWRKATETKYRWTYCK